MPSIVRTVVNWSSNHRAPTPPSDHRLCEICGKKPRFVENGFMHPYCSRSCARNGNGSNPAVCLLHECRATGKPAFANFCSEIHAREGVRQRIVEGCDNCKTQPRTVGDLCISCDRRARMTPRIKELKVDGSTFKSLRAQFLSEWEADSIPKLEKAYQVIVPREFCVKYDAYRTSHAKRDEIRTFHSSQCICDLGFKDSALCNFKSCGICCIIKSSFKAFAFGVPCNNGRFGDGIYSYRNPALADVFATSCTSSPYRVMIACDIVAEAGQGNNEATETESVFVPAADAILPVYVVMYTTQG